MPPTTRPRPATRRRSAPPLTDGQAWARSAALRYVTDARPGITRKRSGAGFSYRDPKGALIRDRETLARIRALAIPPAWTQVWISPEALGHIQATGRDAKGRKQYRYHPRWQEVRGENKYGRMIAFGEALPRIRARVATDLARRDHSREKVLAVVVRLLETTYIRVGNEEYARTNGTFGLTTLRNRHVKLEGDTLRFAFTGKSGKSHAISVRDRRLARLVRQCRDLPGQLLFQYQDDVGETHPVDSASVNTYLREISGDEFTAKDFRTWAGTLLAAAALDRAPAAEGSSRASPLTTVLKAVSAQLGNTPAVCKAGYIHPLVLEAHGSDDLRLRWQAERAAAVARDRLTCEEIALLALLRDAAAQAQRVVSAS